MLTKSYRVQELIIYLQDPGLVVTCAMATPLMATLVVFPLLQGIASGESCLLLSSPCCLDQYSCLDGLCMLSSLSFRWVLSSIVFPVLSWLVFLSWWPLYAVFPLLRVSLSCTVFTVLTWPAILFWEPFFVFQLLQGISTGKSCLLLTSSRRIITGESCFVFTVLAWLTIFCLHSSFGFIFLPFVSLSAFLVFFTRRFP